MTKQPGRAFTAVILAAGEGTRMRSRRPKVLHEVAGCSMLGHVLRTALAAGADAPVVVVGPDRDDVAQEARRLAPNTRVFVQAERRGTAHAVRAAEKGLTQEQDIVVLFADTPLIGADTIARLHAALDDDAAVAVLAFEARDPTGYGRVVLDEFGAPRFIREHKDASAAERANPLCNAGLMALAGRHARALLDAVRDNNAQAEFYLTDVVALARERGLRTACVRVAEEEVQGVNDRIQLADAEAAMQRRLRSEAMRNGVTLQDPASTFLSADAVLDSDVTIEPHVVIGPGVRIASGAVIHAFSHLAGVIVGQNASVGPFARLRPGTVLGASARIGNFVETKAAAIAEGAKVNHLTYIGDALIGAGANIGAGTITCNYDGYAKSRTEIGAGAFVGSNSSLVAPVRIGEGAYIASGSVITADVAPGDLALGRGRQVEKAGWATAFRARNAKPR